MQSRFRSGRIVSSITGGPITMDDICNQQLDRNSTNYKLTKLTKILNVNLGYNR